MLYRTGAIEAPLSLATVLLTDSKALVSPNNSRRTRVLLISNRQFHRLALVLCEAVEHAFERELAANAALLITAGRHAGELAAALVDLHPARFDGVRGPESGADIVRPDIGGEPVVVEASAYDIGEGAADIDSDLEHAGLRITIVRQFPLARQAADEAVELGNGLAIFPPR